MINKTATPALFAMHVSQNRWYPADHLLLLSDKLVQVADGILFTSSPDDLQALADFDRSFFHEDRLGLFRIVIENPNFRGFVARQGGRIVGYLFVTEASENQQVGPLVVDLSHEHAQDITGALIREALKACPKPLYFRCSMLDNSSSNPLKELGAKRVDYHTVRMYLGESCQTERNGILSLGCPGKG